MKEKENLKSTKSMHFDINKLSDDSFFSFEYPFVVHNLNNEIKLHL